MNFKKIARVSLTACIACIMGLSSLQVKADEKEFIEVNAEKENVALNKPAESSKIEGNNVASFAVDGKENTYWAAKNPSELIVDLQGVYDISEINMMSYFETPYNAERYYEYEIWAGLENSEKDMEKIVDRNGTEDREWFTPAGETHTFEEKVRARYIKVKINKTHAEGQPGNNTGHIKELRVYGDLVEEVKVKSNVALNKVAYAPSVEGSSTPNKAVDGNKNTYWAASNPSYLLIDLDGYYDVDEITITPYYSDGRFYHYDVYVSLDGFDFIKVGEKKDDKPQSVKGDTYQFDETLIRYVKVDMLSNSANPAVHVNEVEVMGIKNDSYTPPTDDNEGNIAMNKPTRSYSNQDANPSTYINDGEKATYWSGLYYPAYVDIDLEENYNINTIHVMPSTLAPEAYYQYSVYTSMDGVNFSLLCEKNDKNPVTREGEKYSVDTEARFVRVYLEYCSKGNTGSIAEVKVYGEPSGSELVKRQDIDIPEFKDTKYATEITEEETISEVRGVVTRTIGDEYNKWFEFVLEENAENTNDYYEISNHNGKIQIKGNKGLSLTTGLNHYLKYYCNVYVGQQTSQVKMPKNIVPVENIIVKETPYEVRYAYNYCTHSYTMAFWGADEWQHELDWLALNGVNAILDITGQEEVWRRFLSNFDYSIDEVKDWLVGPGYFGWMYMANMENVNGPVPDSWFAQSTELARSNQRKMRALGMTPILQGYSGMVPNNIKEKDSSIEIIPQGLWNGMQRPGMLKTNTPTYKEFAQLFYQAQEEVYGDISKYYATDPFHEGGQTGGIGRDIVGRAVLDEMKKYDEDAVWVIQSWSFQPALLQNITPEEKQENILLLDLNGTKGAKYTSTNEFAGSNWVYCMLENYGGRSGLAGNLEKYTKIPSQIKNKTKHMKGMGIAPEGTNNNPVKYDLFFEMMWEDEDIDLDTWISNYVIRRYGKESKYAREAWNSLLQSVYLNTSSHADPPESMINARPQFNITKAAPNGNTSRHYNKKVLEKALRTLMKDYDVLKDNESYMYDVTDLLRQCIANSAQEKYNEFTAAYKAGNKEQFTKTSQAFLAMIDLQDRVLNSNVNFMVGTWLNPSKKASEGQDEFTQMVFELNAKALISTWAPYYCWGVYDYANREYGGLTKDYHYKRWEIWIQRLSDALDGKQVSNVNEITTAESHEIAWEWARSDKEYGMTPTGDLKVLYEEYMDKYTLLSENENELQVDPLDIKVSTPNPTMSQFPITNTIDDNTATMWSTTQPLNAPFEVNFEFSEKETINQLSIFPRDYNSHKIGNGDILGIELWSSEDGKNYTKFAEAEYEENGEERICKFDPITTKYVKLVITKTLIWNNNPSLESATAAEFKFFKPYAELKSDVYEIQDTRITKVVENTNVKQFLNNFDVSKNGSLSVKRNDQILEETDIIENGDLVEYYYKDVCVKTYEIELLEEVDFTALNELIALCEKLKENEYPADAWQKFSDELTVAIGVQVNPEATQKEINEAVNNLQKAYDELMKTALADKSELISTIQEAEELKEENYTSNSWKVLSEALSNAKEVNNDDNVTQEEVDEATKALTDAMNALEMVETDKTILEYAITLAEKINEEDLEGCVDVVVEYFNKALANARKVYEDENATKAEVTEAWTTLFDAMHKLDWKKADTSDLKEFVEYADTLVKEDYYESGWAKFEEALAAAKELIADGNNIDQEAVNAALKELMDAASELRSIPDKSELEDLITKVEGMKAEDYTAESWAAFETALANAKAVYNAESEEAEVKAAQEALNAAIKGLEPVTTDSEEDKKPTTPDTETGTDTGDSTNVGGLLTLLGLAGVAIAHETRKRMR